MLSEREKEILSLACLSNKKIAKWLNLSFLTIQRYFVDIYEKYSIKNEDRTKARLIFESVYAGDISIIKVDNRKFKVTLTPIYDQEDLQIVDLKSESGQND